MVWMVLGGAEGWTSRAEEGVWEGGCCWWCSAYGWGGPRCGGFALGRWCSPSAWGQGSFPGVRTGTSSFCWVPPPARFPRGQKHPSLHVSCFSFKGVSQMMSAIFFSILLPLQRDVGVQGWSHQEVIQKNPKALFFTLYVFLCSNCATVVWSASWPWRNPTLALIAWSVEPVELCTN